MTSQDFQKFPVGTGRYAALLDRKGMVVSLFYAFKIDEADYRIILPELLESKTRDIFQKMKFIQKVNILPLPEAKVLIVLGEVPDELMKDKIAYREDSMPLWTLVFNTHEDAHVWAQKNSILDYAKIRLLQIKAGFPEYGTDINEQTILLETRIPIAHQRGKGCYPGQEVIERITSYGKGRTPKTLCSLSINAPHEINSGTKVYDAEGKEAGEVTSAMIDPVEDKTYVLASLQQAYVKTENLFLNKGIVLLNQTITCS